MSEFKRINPADKYFSELAFRLIGFDQKCTPCSFGTAFVILKNLLITAKHVFEEFKKKATPTNISNEFKFTFWAVQIEWSGDEHRYNIWQVGKIYLSAHSDICILQIYPYNDAAAEYNSWKYISISLEPPLVGEKVIGFGYHDTCFNGSIIHPDRKLEYLNVNDKASMSSGHVKKIYMQGRDSVMLPFPCFEVDCRFDPGMSGGLVINSGSELIGIICSSMSGEDGYFSHVAMIWPIMAILLDFKQDGPPPNGRQPLSKLADLGIWRPRGWQRVKVEMQLDTPIPKLMYLS